jgi:hypothetical protein
MGAFLANRGILDGVGTVIERRVNKSTVARRDFDRFRFDSEERGIQ